MSACRLIDCATVLPTAVSRLLVQPHENGLAAPGGFLQPRRGLGTVPHVHARVVHAVHQHHRRVCHAIADLVIGAHLQQGREFGRVPRDIPTPLRARGGMWSCRFVAMPPGCRGVPHPGREAKHCQVEEAREFVERVEVRP